MVSAPPHPEALPGSDLASVPLSLPARIALTVGPVLIFLAGVAVAHVVRGPSAPPFIAAMSLAGLVGGGKLVILAGAIEGAPIGVWGVALLVGYGSVATALILIANMDIVYRIPFAGRRMARLRQAAVAMVQTRTWMRRAAGLGLAVFIALPFQGTGSVGGVVLGQLLGMSRPAILGSVAIGAIVGCGAIAMAGAAAREQITALVRDPVMTALVIVAVLGTTVVLGRWFIGAERRPRGGATDR